MGKYTIKLRISANSGCKNRGNFLTIGYKAKIVATDKIKQLF